LRTVVVGRVTVGPFLDDDSLPEQQVTRSSVERAAASCALASESLHALLLASVEEPVRRAEKLAVVGQLAGGIAHDFNNQLAVTVGYAELLQKHARSEGELRCVNGILEAARHCASLTKNLLAFARVGQREQAEVDLHALIREVAQAMSVHDRMRITLSLGAARPLVLGDASLLRSALLNLAFNALDAMPQGGELQLETRDLRLEEDAPAVAAGPYVELLVVDSGHGMSEEARAHAFEPYYTTKAVGEGTGLGLAAVYGTVVRHAGTIDVQSAPAKGCTFRILLPTLESASRSEATRRRDDKKARILIVDDEPLVREALSAVLEDLDYAVETVADGPSALERVRDRDDIDLVVLDLVLPGMMGDEVFHALRKLRPHLRILLSTGFSGTDDSSALLAAGAVGLLTKPFLARDIDRMLAHALSH
jgi:signal transduction histidine kinase/ActR/RegA family two-component response regulator